LGEPLRRALRASRRAIRSISHSTASRRSWLVPLLSLSLRRFAAKYDFFICMMGDAMHCVSRHTKIKNIIWYEYARRRRDKSRLYINGDFLYHKSLIPAYLIRELRSSDTRREAAQCERDSSGTTRASAKRGAGDGADSPTRAKRSGSPK
jgi:hypothetical protein